MSPDGRGRAYPHRRTAPLPRILLRLVLITGVMALLGGLPGALTVRAEFDSNQIARATVLIEAVVLKVENEFRKPLYDTFPLGSGVIVSNEGLVLTNSHVVDLTALESTIDDHEISLGAELEIQEFFQISVVEGISDAPNPSYRAEILSDRPEIDLAVLAITGNELGIPLGEPVGVDRPPVALAPAGALRPRDSVYIFGYPTFGSGGEDPRFSTIDVIDSAVRKLVGLGADVERIEINATVGSGSSGGAVVDDNGQLVGIVTLALSAVAGGSVAVAIPVNRARAVLAAAGWVDPIPIPTQAPTPGSTLVTPTIQNPPSSLDSARFVELIGARGEITRIAGPFNGDIVQDDVNIATQGGAGLTTEDFSARVTMLNPARLTGRSWDLGFTFHHTADSSVSVGVDSTGTWFLITSPGGALLASGVVPGIDTSPEGLTTLDLMVEGSTGLFGVNGQFVTRLDLPPAIASDVFVGSGYLVRTTESGRAIAFADFEVWPLPATASPASTGTPAPAATAVASATSTSLTPAFPFDPLTPAADPDAAREFDALLFESLLPPDFGPFFGELEELTSGEVQLTSAGAQLANFGASVKFSNPDTTAVLSDIGMEFRSNITTGTRTVIVLDSLGTINAYPAGGVPPPAVTAASYDMTPGATNTFQVFVSGDKALVGVNDRFVTAVPLLAPPVTSDVSIGPAFNGNHFVQGRVTRFGDFRVWDLTPSTPATSTLAPPASMPATPLPPTNAPEQPTGTPEPPTNSPSPPTSTRAPPTSTPSPTSTLDDVESSPNDAGTPRAASAAGEVPMFRANAARTGEMPGPGPVGKPVVRWRFETGGPVVSSAAVDDGIVYFGSADENLYAVDAQTGRERWRFQTGNAISASPAVVAGLVYIGGNSGQFQTLDAYTGEERWRFTAESSDFKFSSPAIADGTVFVQGSDSEVSTIFAIDAATGQERWQFTDNGIGACAPSVGDGIVYFSGGIATNTFYALDAVTGDVRWSIPSHNSVFCPVAVSEGALFVRVQGGELYALDAQSGAELWRFAPDNPVDTAVAVANGVVYVGTFDDFVYALDVLTGAENWRFATADGDISAPTVADGVVYASGGDNIVYALDAVIGAERWRFTAGIGVLASPAVVDGSVYTGSYDGSFYAIGGSDGP